MTANIIKLKTVLLKYNLVFENSYLQQYLDLLDKNINTKANSIKTQAHHAIPVCFYTYTHNLKKNNSRCRTVAENFANKDQNNFIVNLTYSDHILAHCLLALCSKEGWFKKSNLNVLVTAKIHLTPKEFCELESKREYQIAYEQRILQLIGHSVSDSTRAKMSQSVKNRCKNTPHQINLNRIVICMPESPKTTRKFVSQNDFKIKYEPVGYRISKELTAEKKLLHSMKNYTEFKKGKILMKKPTDSAYTFVPVTDKEKYIELGYIVLKSQKNHSEETRNKMRHPHKKMQSTENMSRPKWIYLYNNIEFAGVIKIQEYLASIGYKLSQGSIIKFATNAVTLLTGIGKKFPELINKISRREL